MLKINDIHVFYGIIEAVKGISLEVNEGEIVSLIGANGAGKSTILRTLSGLMKPTSGDINYLDKSLSTMATTEIVKQGIAHVPEGRHVFKGMTVKENLMMGAYTRKDKQNLEADMARIFNYFPILKERFKQDAATLSGGEQQMLAMGRALMARPKLLLLDEPSMGLAPLYIKQIFEIIQVINQEGTTILLIEQNAKAALEICDRAYVLETGHINATGTGEELLASEEVQKAYLGVAT